MVKMNSLLGDLSHISANTATLVRTLITAILVWEYVAVIRTLSFICRNIGYLASNICYFCYLENKILDQSIQETFNLILKTEALVIRCL